MAALALELSALLRVRVASLWGIAFRSFEEVALQQWALLEAALTYLSLSLSYDVTSKGAPHPASGQSTRQRGA